MQDIDQMIMEIIYMMSEQEKHELLDMLMSRNQAPENPNVAALGQAIGGDYPM